MVLRFCVAFLRNFSVHGVVLLVFTGIWISAAWDFFSRRVSYTFLNFFHLCILRDTKHHDDPTTTGEIGKAKRSFHQNWRLDGQGLPLQPTIRYGSFYDKKGLCNRGGAIARQTSCGFLFFLHIWNLNGKGAIFIL
ncbi:hypothetical protein B0T13DRAFT_474423 [Neurospora crassa]|nr:hypothetical protein B0T13DRAFT_474423 [Neurospora crassa]